MGKVIKLTESELLNIVRRKINEALEHNVDLDYSPAIGNKKRGPGKNTMDQMRKRRNTALDEDILHETSLRDSNGYCTIDISDEVVDAFKTVFGEEMGDDVDWEAFADEKYEELGLPQEIELHVDFEDTYDPGDDWTGPSGGEYITGYEITEGQIENYPPEIQEVIKTAVSEHMYKMDDIDDIHESRASVRFTQSQLHNFIFESVKKVLNEIGYHEKQPKKQSEEEHDDWVKGKAAAKKRYYASQKKEKEDGATDYHDYKHGNHPVIKEISSKLYNRASDKAFNDMMQNLNDYPTMNKRERQWKNFSKQARIRGDEEKNAVCPYVDERELPNMPAGTYVVMDGDGRDAVSANFRTRYSGHAGTEEQCEEYVDRFYDKNANWEYLPEIIPLEQYLKNKR